MLLVKTLNFLVSLFLGIQDQKKCSGMFQIEKKPLETMTHLIIIIIRGRHIRFCRKGLA